MQVSIDQIRRIEIEKYVKEYRENPDYKMGDSRKLYSKKVIHKLRNNKLKNQSYLDIGCGRAEMLKYAVSLGYIAKGIEANVDLCGSGLGYKVVFGYAHNMPCKIKKFHVVSMFDVIEHLIPGDDELAFKELLRVSSGHIVITANNKDSFSSKGEQLHINKRSYGEWEELFNQWSEGLEVECLNIRNASISEMWVIHK